MRYGLLWIYILTLFENTIQDQDMRAKKVISSSLLSISRYGFRDGRGQCGDTSRVFKTTFSVKQVVVLGVAISFPLRSQTATCVQSVMLRLRFLWICYFSDGNIIIGVFGNLFFLLKMCCIVDNIGVSCSWSKRTWWLPVYNYIVNSVHFFNIGSRNFESVTVLFWQVNSRSIELLVQA